MLVGGRMRLYKTELRKQEAKEERKNELNRNKMAEERNFQQLLSLSDGL